MEQHTKKHARHSFYHLKNAFGGLKIAMRGAFLNIKSMLALQIIYSIFYTLIEYSLFQLLLSIALKIDGYSFLNSANIGRFDHACGNRNASDFIFDCVFADLS